MTYTVRHRLVFASFLCLAACQSSTASEPMSFDGATRVVLDDVLDADEKVIVFGHPVPVDETNDLRPYSLTGADAAPIEIDAESWLFMIDDAPLAEFRHPTRFVLVDRETGEVEVSPQRWWPVLDGVSLFTDGYEDPGNWIYPGMDVAPRAGKVADTRPTAADDEEPCQGKGYGLVVNAWTKGQTLQDGFTRDAELMDAVLTRGGLDTTYFGPVTDPQADRDASKAAVRGHLVTRALEMKAGDTLVIYIGGHGHTLDSGTGIIGDYWEDDLVEVLGRFDPGVNIVFVAQGCESGGFIDGIRTVADLVITATNDELPSYGDFDSRGPVEFLFGAPPDPNPDDAGSEFTSGLVEALEARLRPAEVARLQERAKVEQTSFWEEAFYDAYPDALANDFGFLLGLTRPQRVLGDPATTHGQVAPADAPICPEDDIPDEPDDDNPEDPDEPDDGDSTPEDCNEELTDLEKVARLLGGLDEGDPEVKEKICGEAQPDEMGEPVPHSDGLQTRPADGPTDTWYFGAAHGCYEEQGWSSCGDDPAATSPGIDAFPCGEGPNATVLCPVGPEDPSGEMVFVYNVLGSEVAPTDPMDSFQFGFVFDTDSNDSNNYQASASFPNDFFDSTDRWYVANYTAGLGWTMNVIDALNGQPLSLPSNARILISGNVIGLVVPLRELGPDPSYRVTSFRHQGDFGLEGGDWNADVVPPVHDPLIPLP